MPRAQAISIQNDFSRGLITEASGLTFPENAVTEQDNCVFDDTGLVHRRLGFDFEDGFVEIADSTVGNVVVAYVWKNVAGEGDLIFVVKQLGDVLSFYKVVSGSALSDNLHGDTIALSTYFPSGVTSVKTQECQFSDGNGLLFVTHPRLNSFYVSYDPDADTFSSTLISVSIRDFEGDEADALAIDSRPTSNLAGLTAAHRYNLLNQGWTTTNLTSWDTARSDMPSNCDVSWYFKNSSNAFDFSVVDNRLVGNSPAPRGHFAYSIYDVDRSSNFAGATDYAIATERLSTSAFFAGRVFYSGLDVLKQNSRVFFTQIVEREDQYSKCYQINDPTSEQQFDLLPSDGGVIDLQEAGSIIKLFPMLNALLVFASNGIWAITGSQGTGFTATDFTIAKISTVPAISHTSFINADGRPLWWNFDGIYTVSIDQNGGFKVDSISQTTIQSFYNNILTESKELARGTYDRTDKIVRWIYRSSVTSSFEDKYRFDRILCFNTMTGAFYSWSVDISNVQINAIVHVDSLGGTFEEFNVVDGGTPDNVVDGGTPDQVIVFLAAQGSVSSVIKYLVSYDTGAALTWAETRDTDYVDWMSFDDTGVSFTSYFVSGYRIRGDGIRRFQENYINVFCDNETDNSFKIQGQWNYSTSGNSGKWSTSQVFSNTAGDFNKVMRKAKIRGSGHVCQFRISNNANNPFDIFGWSVFDTANRWI